MAAGITRLGLFGGPRVNRTSPRVQIAQGFSYALAVGLAVNFIAGVGSSSAVGTATGIGVGLAGSAVGSASGSSQAVARSRVLLTRLGPTATPLPYRTRQFNGASAKNWTVALNSSMSGTISPIDTFFVNLAMFADIQTNAVVAPQVAARAQGSSAVDGRSGSTASAAGTCTANVVAQALTSIFAIGVGDSRGIGSASAAAPTVGVATAAGTSSVTAEGAGPGTASGAGSASGTASVIGVGSFINASTAATVASSQGAGAAVGVSSGPGAALFVINAAGTSLVDGQSSFAVSIISSAVYQATGSSTVSGQSPSIIRPARYTLTVRSRDNAIARGRNR